MRMATCHPEEQHWAFGLCRSCYPTHYYRRHKERTDARARELRFARYGWTVDQYDAALAKQDNKCFLCGREGGEGHRALVPDHDHDTNQPRRLLCRFCNSAIGLLRDDPDLIARAAEYIAAHKPLAVMADEETRVTDPATGGMKGKKLARFDLLPVEPLTEVARLYGRGAEKYADRNWELGYDWGLSFAALMRHAWAFWGGESIDPETERHHLASVCFHAMALMEYERKGRGTDSRSTSDPLMDLYRRAFRP